MQQIESKKYSGLFRAGKSEGDSPKVVLSLSHTSPVLSATWVLENTKQVPKQVPSYMYV